MKKNLVVSIVFLVLSGIIISETAVARKHYYEDEYYHDPDAGYPAGDDGVYVEERSRDRGRTIAKGAGYGALGGGLLGLAAGGGKGFGYGALAGAGVGILGGAIASRKKRRRVVRARRARYADGYEDERRPRKQRYHSSY